jgi:hypothetical protein
MYNEGTPNPYECDLDVLDLLNFGKVDVVGSRAAATQVRVGPVGTAPAPSNAV